MSDLKISIDPKDPILNEVFQRAFLQSFTDEAKNKLMESAMAHLFKPSDNYYGEKISPISRAVLGAAEVVAKEHVQSLMRDPESEFSKKLREAMSKIVERLANSFASDVFVQLLEKVMMKTAEQISRAY